MAVLGMWIDGVAISEGGSIHGRGVVVVVVLWKLLIQLPCSYGALCVQVVHQLRALWRMLGRADSVDRWGRAIEAPLHKSRRLSSMLRLAFHTCSNKIVHQPMQLAGSIPA